MSVATEPRHSQAATIKQAQTAAEIAAARLLFEEYAGWIGINLDFQNFATELATLPGGYAPPSGALLLLIEGETPVGCVAMRPFAPPAICEMKRLYVRPTLRGRGYGEALVHAIIACARAAGYERMRLDTLPAMANAQTLYRRLGFQEIPAYCYNPVPGTTYMEIKLL